LCKALLTQIRGSHVAWTAAAAYLLFSLINELRVEWTLNEQYHYGWAVPFLAGFLFWRRCLSFRSLGSRGASPACTIATAAFLLFFLLPLRIIQEANSDWRFVSWALALDLTGLFLSALFYFGGPAAVQHFVFPILFLLVAVPWPSGIEQWLVQHLSRANTALAIEILGWAGIPALQHGNLVQLSTGLIEIDPACSGIRSLQAVIMAAAFFGEFYLLNRTRRFYLFAAGLLLALLCNVVRTVTLVWIAAARGLVTMSAWHDTAGIAILLACLTGLYIASDLLRTRRPSVQNSPLPIRTAPSCGAVLGCLAWFALIELTTFLWYHLHEINRPSPVVWRFKLPSAETDVTNLPISTDVRRILHFDFGQHARWQQPDGATIETYFFEWLPGRSAATLARNHTPEVCLPAAGRNILAEKELTFAIKGLKLPFREYTLNSARLPTYVFYCLWEDCAGEQSAKTEFLTIDHRLRNVLQGRRNQGQRVLHIAVHGAGSDSDALSTVRELLEQFLSL
jgi:exosortase